MEYMENLTEYVEKQASLCQQHDVIDKELYARYGVKRGLRDENGQGVLTGLTNISQIIAFKDVDGQKVPCDGQLLYRGYDVQDLVKGGKGKRHIFEEAAYLLLFGELPTEAQLSEFSSVIAESMNLPTNFTRDVIMKAPSVDIMNSMTRSVLTLASYDNQATNLDIDNVLRQCIGLIGTFPMMAVYGYHAYNHYENDGSMYIHRPDRDASVAENILRMLRPDMKYTELEAREYVEKLQQVMRYIGISDCKMQEGSMRCDVNISVRPKGSEKLGTRTEIKNMNSINNIAKAMEYEFERQVDLIENGGSVVQETLRYDDATNTTSSMRSKEDAHDYRYFRDPDLVTIHVPKDVVEEIKAAMPELPADKCRRYIDELAIPEKDAQLLTKYRKISEYFDKACEGVKSPKTVSNFIIGQIFRRTETEADKEIFDVAVTPEQLNELVKLLDSGKIRNNLAKATLEKMLDSGKGALEFISESDMGGLDENALNDLCKQAVESNPKAVEDYKNGKEKAIKSLVGNVMKNSRGKADPALAESKIKELIG